MKLISFLYPDTKENPKRAKVLEERDVSNLRMFDQSNFTDLILLLPVAPLLSRVLFNRRDVRKLEDQSKTCMWKFSEKERENVRKQLFAYKTVEEGFPPSNTVSSVTRECRGQLLSRAICDVCPQASALTTSHLWGAFTLLVAASVFATSCPTVSSENSPSSLPSLRCFAPSWPLNIYGHLPVSLCFSLSLATLAPGSLSYPDDSRDALNTVS